MPENNDRDRHELARELEKLRKAVSELEGKSCSANNDLLAILRLCPGIEPEDWEEFAANHNLAEWLALPMSGDLYPHVVRVQNLISELSRKSEQDALTGLANRRAFERVLDLEVERSLRNKSPVSLAMIDLDDFKQVNDTYGHACGDQVLVGLGRVLGEHKRRYDLAARVGGEEFALILPGVNMTRAQNTLERLADEVRALVFDCGGESVNVTCSMGLATYKGRIELDAGTLFDLADKALYDAKTGGKNRLVCAPIPDMVPVEPDKSLVHSNEKQFLFTGLK